ncbi:CHAP domain-containing protein [Nocardioides bizhenqiangii]|uniref:CHAP domain-containing protein n=1 Tax=Nocardioides bizhenqiangii TaxID=3095076 RepID=A0ABZ0ZWU2_9ACTN|nr:CHAP domain-containing protein [Nocardioides sp. HM61]WQQ27773.1 CHAP domain-containing protein [Nocardioides sp. HM61]
MRLGRTLWRGGTALLTSTLVATLLVVAGVQQQGGRSAPAESPETTRASGSTYLCTGYAGCRNAGYSDAGYGAVNSRMYWRMYSGHNCTNYAAYRMIKAGMSTERPWDGSGMAYNWGHAMSHITDNRPSVGAVAWWDRYDNGIGSSGHVAYVERVVSADEIVISEDSWSGDFHWRTITRDSGRWPTGFIHFVDKAVQNVAAPAITGTPQVGSELRVSRGGWSPKRDLTISWQWYADGVAVAGATDQTFTPTAAERGKRITAAVTARRSGYSPATATAAPTAPVARGVFTVLAPPTITGDPTVDEVLTANPATWSPPSRDTLYRWKADGVLIAGATGRTLTLTRDLLGKTIVVATHGRREGYRNSPVRSAPVGPVVIGEIVASTPSTVSGRARIGQVLTAQPGAVQPTDATVAYQWLRDGVPVAGATAATYTLSSVDLGTTMAAQITRSRRNYADLVETVAVARAVSAKPTMTLSAVGRSRKAVVTVQLTVPDVTVPGQVTVKVGGQVATATLVDGRARLVVGGVEPGDRLVRAWYAGSGPIRPAKSSTTVRVLR